MIRRVALGRVAGDSAALQGNMVIVRIPSICVSIRFEGDAVIDAAITHAAAASAKSVHSPTGARAAIGTGARVLLATACILDHECETIRGGIALSVGRIRQFLGWC